jgi:hypothetical protein
MKFSILPSELGERQKCGPSWALSFYIVFLALAFDTPARCQQPAPTSQSIVEAARNARERQENNTQHPKIITDDDLGAQAVLPSPAVIPPEPPAKKEAEAQTPTKPGCDNPDAERLKAELQAAQHERDQLRNDLAYQPKVISDGDVDMTNFKPGSSGLDNGTTPLTQAQPVAPARVTEVMVDEKIASLNDALRIACGSPKDAGTQRKLDSAEQQLKLLQQEFSLDQDVYYSKPNYSEDAAGKEKLDAEQQQIESLRAEIEQLKSELAAPETY